MCGGWRARARACDVRVCMLACVMRASAGPSYGAEQVDRGGQCVLRGGWRARVRACNVRVCVRACGMRASACPSMCNATRGGHG